MNPLGIAIIMEDNLEQTLQWAKENGFTNCQLQLWNLDYLCREHAEHVKKLTESLGMEVTGLWCGWHGPVKWDFIEGPSVLGIVPMEYRATRIKNLLDGAEYARILGVKDIITHLGFVPLNCRDINYTGVVSALKYITSELKKYGQNFLMETGQEPPIVLRRLIDDVGSDNLFVNYDPANLLMYGNANPIDGLNVLGEFVRSMHAKDGSYPKKGYELGQEYPIGKGDVDFARLIQKLKEIGYDGPMSIEYEISAGDNKQKQEIIEGKVYLEQFL